MRKKPIDKDMPTLFYSKKKLMEIIDSNLDNESFEIHCREVAEKLKLNPIIVKELLKDNALLVLSKLQESAIKNKAVKINITGFFSFVTEITKRKIIKINR